MIAILEELLFKKVKLLVLKKVFPKALNKLPLDLYLAAGVCGTVLGCIGAYELLSKVYSLEGIIRAYNRTDPDTMDIRED